VPGHDSRPWGREGEHEAEPARDEIVERVGHTVLAVAQGDRRPACLLSPIRRARIRTLASRPEGFRSMPDASLLLLLDEVRGKTLRILDAASDGYARWAPPGLENHILWHAGHSYVVVELLAMRALGRLPEIPDGWFEMFAWESRPAQVSSDRWPPLSGVISRLESQHKRLRRVIGGLTEEQLDRSSADNPRRTVRYAILHGLHDEAGHSGEAYLLMKIQARSAGVPRTCPPG
jgi:hypothetical protein